MSREIEEIIRTMGPEELARYLAIGGEVSGRVPNAFAAKAIIHDLQKEATGELRQEGIDKIDRRRKVV